MTSVDTPTRTGQTQPWVSGVRRLLARQEVSLLFVVVAIAVATTVKALAFFTAENVVQVLDGSVTYFVVGCGTALLVIGGGLDFSVGAAFTLGGLVTAKALVSNVPWPLAVVLGLSSCLAVGLLNFAIITYWHVPPIIATLGSFYAIIGVTTLMTSGIDVVPLPSTFQALAQNKVFGVPNAVVFAVALGIVTWFILQYTAFGVNIRALGGNRAAAIGNGLPVVRLDMVLYGTAGVAAGAAGIIYASTVGSGQVNAGGAGATLSVITAVLIGGVSLLGGLGTIQGVAVGSVLLSMINNALVLAGIPPTYDSIFIGVILVCAVALDHLRRERLYRKR